MYRRFTHSRSTLGILLMPSKPGSKKQVKARAWKGTVAKGALQRAMSGRCATCVQGKENTGRPSSSMMDNPTSVAHSSPITAATPAPALVRGTLTGMHFILIQFVANRLVGNTGATPASADTDQAAASDTALGSIPIEDQQHAEILILHCGYLNFFVAAHI